MLRINHDGCNIQIRFDHGILITRFLKNQLVIEEERRYTNVKIIFPDYCDNTEFQGRATCHPKDNFCKSTGRKLALANAMVDFDRELRAAIWQEYLKHCK